MQLDFVKIKSQFFPHPSSRTPWYQAIPRLSTAVLGRHQYITLRATSTFFQILIHSQVTQFSHHFPCYKMQLKEHIFIV